MSPVLGPWAVPAKLAGRVALCLDLYVILLDCSAADLEAKATEYRRRGGAAYAALASDHDGFAASARLRLAEARAARDAFDGCAPWRARPDAAEVEAAVARLMAESAAEVAAREAEGLDPARQRPGVPDGIGAPWPGGAP